MNNFQSLYMSEFLPDSPFNVTNHELAVFMRSFGDDCAKVWADFVEDNQDDSMVRQARTRLSWMAEKTEQELLVEREGEDWAHYIRREYVTELVGSLIKIYATPGWLAMANSLNRDTLWGGARFMAASHLYHRARHEARSKWLPAIMSIFVVN